MGYRKACFLRHLTDLILRIGSHRHQGVGQLALGQIVKGIGLIFGCGHGITDRKPSVWQLRNPGIMSGRNVFRSQAQAFGKKRFPFHIPVAGDTRVRRSSLTIFFDKIIDNIFLKFFFEIHYIIRDIQPLRHSSCVIHRTEPAAASVFFLDLFRFILPNLHGNADNVISLFFQQKGCHRGVNSPGHAHYNFFAHILVFFLCFFFTFMNI